jgi:CRP-like cAMP-binding protein
VRHGVPLPVTSNRLFGNFAKADAALVLACLVPVDLPRRRVLEDRGREIEHIYFFCEGLASVVATGAVNRSIEVGIMGSEGMSGLAVIAGTDRSPYDTFMQVPGHGWQMTATDLRRLMRGSETLRDVLSLYGQAMTVQMGYTAFANGKFKLEERLARWLLMAHDRANTDVVSLTHEFLAIMLGVRRAGVTEVIDRLEKTGVIHSKRGSVVILDREALKALSAGSYGAAEAEYERLFPRPESSLSGSDLTARRFRTSLN